MLITGISNYQMEKWYCQQNKIKNIYIEYKDALNPENYAMSIMNWQERALTSQLRMGILAIKI